MTNNRILILLYIINQIVKFIHNDANYNVHPEHLSIPLNHSFTTRRKVN